jgi:hypothetical protein
MRPGVPAERLVAYRVDPLDRIEWVNEAWVRFALENDGALELSDPVGTSIWAGVHGGGVRRIWRAIFTRARSIGLLEIGYRCDAPGMHRDLRMRLIAEHSGTLHVTTWPLREFARPEIPLLDSRTPRQSGLAVTSCAWCRSFRTGSGWVPVEQAVERLGLLAAESMPTISYGVCGGCEDSLQAVLQH